MQEDKRTQDQAGASAGVSPEEIKPVAGVDDKAADQDDRGYEELKELLTKTEAEAAEYLDLLRRTQAEMENFRKRMIKEHERVVECAAEGVVSELLPLVDNLERALSAAKIDEAESNKLLGGVELIYSQLIAILEKQGVEVINPAGAEFDPQKHQAVMQVESDEYGENMVVEVLQKGYDLRGKLIRPAMVKVSK